MEVEIIIGTYDCFIKGYSFDLIATDQVLKTFFVRVHSNITLIIQRIRPKFYEKAHAGCLKALACSGRYLASGSTDETIK